MKDQKHNQGEDHEHSGQSHKSQPHTQKASDREESKKADTQQHAHARETAGREGSEQADRAGKMKSGKAFADLDHDKIQKFHDEMDKDEGLKQRFQQDPHGVLGEHGVSLPEGYKATYDHQYIKPSDGSKAGMYGYRFGNINFTK